MEIKLDNVSYVKNANTSFSKKCLDEVTYEFAAQKITAVCQNNDDLIGYLLTSIIKPTNGAVVIDGVSIDSKAHVNRVEKLRKSISYIPRKSSTFIKDTVYEELKYVMRNFSGDLVEDKIKGSLKLVGLKEELLESNPKSLCLSEQKKVQLATALIHNPKTIILDNFEKGLNYRDQLDLKRLLRKLKTKYNKTVIIISNNTNFLLDIVDNLVVIHDGKLVYKGDNKSFYDGELYNYVETPELVEFIYLARNKGRDILPYYDIKELIKAVYRDVR